MRDFIPLVYSFSVPWSIHISHICIQSTFLLSLLQSVRISQCSFLGSLLFHNLKTLKEQWSSFCLMFYHDCTEVIDLGEEYQRAAFLIYQGCMISTLLPVTLTWMRHTSLIAWISKVSPLQIITLPFPRTIHQKWVILMSAAILKEQLSSNSFCHGFLQVVGIC